MQDDLGVGRRLHHGAFAHQLAAQRQAVGQIAVVADGKAAGIKFGEQRLHVAQDGLAGGRIAHVADRGVARQAIDHFTAGEGIADQSEAALGMKTFAVEGDDAGGLLAAMLQGVQAERRDRGGVGMTENAEYAAFFPRAVVFEIEKARFCHGHRPAISQCTVSLDLQQSPRSDAGVGAACRARRADRARCPEYRFPPAAAASTSSRWWLPGSSGNIDISH